MINIFDNIKDGLQGSSAFYSLTEQYSNNRISQNNIVKDGYLSNQDVYAVVSRVARLCASLPICINNGKMEMDKGDAFYDFFNEKWGNESGKNQGLNAVFTNLFLFGRAYILKDSESIGFMPDNQFVLPTNQVTPSATKVSYFEGPKWYDFNDGSTIHKYLPEELIIIQFYDPTGYESNADGLSPLNSVWKTVTASNNRNHAEAKLLENRGIAGFISPKGNNVNGGLGLSDRVMTYLRESFSKVVGGAKNFNKIVAVEEGVDFTQVGMSAGDLRLIEMRLNHVRDICNAYGVPSLLFNDYQSRTHANYGEAKKSLYSDFVLPMWDLFYNQYERKFINEWNDLSGSDYWIEIKKSEIEALQVDRVALNTEVLAQFDKKLITLGEAREALGLSHDKPEETQVEKPPVMQPIETTEPTENPIQDGEQDEEIS